ncbi:hypothetical protein PEBR_08783 [Penicillium brasilianum]|uniref:Myb-like DNA-binding domain-containing protein n=1 Tax=Penicillium brasilianum TaxID=104259 RepID=A0A1S9S1D8_PENBI|nr:hypothetical protein PEBR_08783 [Penicillium brasilianum]
MTASTPESTPAKPAKLSAKSPDSNKKVPEKDTTLFLITCIMQSAVGKLEKIDFEQVAQKLNITNKVAARMRYHRLLASYGLNGSFAPTRAGQIVGSPAGDMTAAEPSTPTPKRKSTKRKRSDTETPDQSEGDQTEV